MGLVKSMSAAASATSRVQAPHRFNPISTALIREVSLRPISPFSNIKVTHIHISVQTRAVGHEKVISYTKRRDIIVGNARYLLASDNAS
jgi:hypothetical protein